MNAFDAVAFFQEQGIEYVTEGSKHARHGWVQIRCPFCFGKDGWHLGYNLQDGWWNCWRCGHKKTWNVIVALLDGDRIKAKKVVKDYEGRPLHRTYKNKYNVEVLEVPQGLQPLTNRARSYLESRRFDPDLLELVWNIQSTSIFGNVKHRIYIPITLDGQAVSWQCRAISDSSPLKYIAQEESKEIVNNKHVLYGIDNVLGDKCVVVEGVTDVWRFGPGAVATFGIQYSKQQVQQLISRFEEIFIVFDAEDQAQKQADLLKWTLQTYGKKVHICELLNGDPGDMNQNEADAFITEILGHKNGY